MLTRQRTLLPTHKQSISWRYTAQQGPTKENCKQEHHALGGYLHPYTFQCSCALLSRHRQDHRCYDGPEHRPPQPMVRRVSPHLNACVWGRPKSNSTDARQCDGRHTFSMCTQADAPCCTVNGCLSNLVNVVGQYSDFLNDTDERVILRDMPASTVRQWSSVTQPECTCTFTCR